MASRKPQGPRIQGGPAPGLTQLSEGGSEARAVLENIGHFRQPGFQVLGRKVRTGPEPRDVEEDPTWVAVVPDGFHMESARKFVDDYRDAPRRATGRVRCATPTSFAEWMHRFARNGSVIFADMDDPGFHGRINYHKPGGQGEKFIPGFDDFGAYYACELTDDWRAWVHSGEMTQGDFAKFLDDQLDNILHPDAYPDTKLKWCDDRNIKPPTPAELVKFATDLDVRVEHRVKNSFSATSGTKQLVFTEEHKTEGGETLKIPGGFVIALAAFKGQAPFALAVRLQYRIRNGQALWRVNVHRADIALERAFGDIQAVIASRLAELQIELPIFQGSPAAG